MTAPFEQTTVAPMVVGLGEVLWDKYPDDDEKLGGAPLNFAFHAAQLGAPGFIVSAVGDDAYGKAALRELESNRLSTKYVQVLGSEMTGSSLISFIDEQPHFQFTSDVAYDKIEWNEDLERLAERADVICFGTLAQRAEKSRESIQRFVLSATEARVRLFDLNLRLDNFTPESIEFGLHQSNVVKLSESELNEVGKLCGWSGSYQTLAENLCRDFGKELVAVTRGANGCFLQGETEALEVPAQSGLEVIDPTGAGDAFAAALALGVWQKVGLQEMGEYANEIGGFVASQKGAMPKLIR